MTDKPKDAGERLAMRHLWGENPHRKPGTHRLTQVCACGAVRWLVADSDLLYEHWLYRVGGMWSESPARCIRPLPEPPK